ncbi:MULTISPECIES: tetratricopeptide repeat protein [Acidobacteriaceae]|uniref:tetratricopeptide repeat protein n=1 Tax=Acidobacteriaceae TaxID=204434 RepID=UPI00131E7D70|nr:MULTISPECIES: tetratricopeptide repeat protein [Acidobacteriaceae]MDW5266519.1 tetratricopeptide repeat protein [Edaphobacter sp.]
MRSYWRAVALLIFCSATGRVGLCQRADEASAHAPDLQQRYDAAQRAQSAGDLATATGEYRGFLTDTLRHLADGYVRAGDYPGGAKFFEEALAVVPEDKATDLRLAYAQAALLARDIPTAKSQASAVVAADPDSSTGRLIFGEALLQTDENEEARKQLEVAVALDPNYKNGLALATAYLALSNTKDASKLFNEMSAGFGNTAAIHLDFGRAYAEAGNPDLAIEEFKKAIALNPRLPEAHYCLGASYLLSQGQVGFPEAVKEFYRELELNPNDYFSLAQLGYIAFNDRRFPEAEEDLKRAASLDPRNPDNPLLLGQIYIQLNRPADAALALRKAIALSTDLSRNHYQVQRAHYLLGRLLVQTGHVDEAKQEMQISASLLKMNSLRDQARMTGAPISDAASIAPFQRPPDPAPMDVKARQALDDFTKRAVPAIADSYNNLGAMAAGASEFATATGYFAKAAKWNSSLEGLDYNWGRAAFSAQLYAQAVPPLSRYLAAHPQESGARRVLGISYFMVKDYAAVVQTLRPIESSLATTPQLASMYAQSLAHTEKKGTDVQP